MATTTSEHDSYISDDAPPRWRAALVWPVVLVVGWVIYELTAQPALGVAAICLKFGWEDLRTALWLRRTDPNWRRALAYLWLYLASGLWKAAATACIMLIGFAVLATIQHAAGAQLQREAHPQVKGAILTAIAGCGLSILASLIAIGLALCFRVKLWLNSGMHRARRRNAWPPPANAVGKYNRGYLLVVGMFQLTLVPALFYALIVLGTQLLPQGWPMWALFVILLALLPFGGIGIYSFAGGILDRRVFPETPRDCWIDVPEPDTDAAMIAAATSLEGRVAD